MGAVTPGETLGTLYNIHVGSNKTKQHRTSVTVLICHNKTKEEEEEEEFIRIQRIL